jgi:hypothetical protein
VYLVFVAQWRSEVGALHDGSACKRVSLAKARTSVDPYSERLQAAYGWSNPQDFDSFNSSLEKKIYEIQYELDIDH